MTNLTTPSNFRVAIAQLAPTLGNLQANLKLHLDQIEAARAGGADLVVFPELSLTGYYLRDQVPEVAEPREGPLVQAIAEAAGTLSVVFGFVEETRDYRFFNAAAFVEGGRVRYTHRKVYLPTYGMFDEQRYFAAGSRIRAFETRFGRIGILICEDAWHLSCGVILQAEAIDAMILIANSPGRGVRESELGSAQSWNLLTRTYATFFNIPVVFANRVGYEDGVCFWGGSRLVGPSGRVVLQGPEFEPALLFADVDHRETRLQRIIAPLHRDERPHLTFDELKRIHDENSRPDGD
jgi:predicted amidohydrolase